VPSAPPLLRQLSRLIGYERAEAVALRYRDVKQRYRSIRGRQSDEGFWEKPSMASHAKATAGQRDEVRGDA
jgi:hypothetical protein